VATSRKPAARKTGDPDDIELQDDGPDLPVTGSKTEQHPSLGGDPDAEIAQRTADGTASTPGRYRKTFVLDVALAEPAVLAESHTSAMKQEAAQRGLRATGDPVLVDTQVTEHRRGTTTALTYEMPVTPAAVPPPSPADDEA
jgi:hypothetical protein